MRMLYAVCLVFAISTGLSRAEVYEIDASHAEIGFKVKHMLVSKTGGKFTTFSGKIDFDSAKKELVSAKCTIEAASVDTSNGKRDAHLKNKDFFNVEKFPNITFESTGVKKQADGTFALTGNLSILGNTKAVELPVTVNGPINDPYGMKRIGFETSTSLNRRDFGLTHGKAVTIGDVVTVEISVEATRK